MATFKHDDPYVAAFVWTHFEAATYKGLEPKEGRGSRQFFNICIDVPNMPEKHVDDAVNGFVNDAVDVPAKFYADCIHTLFNRIREAKNSR